MQVSIRRPVDRRRRVGYGEKSGAAVSRLRRGARWLGDGLVARKKWQQKTTFIKRGLASFKSSGAVLDPLTHDVAWLGR